MSRMSTIADLRKVLEELEEERDVLVKHIESIRNTVNLLESRTETTSTPSQQAQTLRDSVYEILSEQHPLHRRSIYDKLIERGIPVGGVDPVNTVGAHLSKDDRFRNVDRGRWDLTERHITPNEGSDKKHLHSIDVGRLNMLPGHRPERHLPDDAKEKSTPVSDVHRVRHPGYRRLE